SSGQGTIGFTSPDVSRGKKGGGTVAILVFQAEESGEASISLSGVMAMGPSGSPLTFETRECQIIIR
ncbi:hypothetical protein DRQ11_14325, partial [candidate division KSB1 bacterium]